MAYCIMCGAELPEGAAFCGECGSPVARRGSAEARREQAGEREGEAPRGPQAVTQGAADGDGAPHPPQGKPPWRSEAGATASKAAASLRALAGSDIAASELPGEVRVGAAGEQSDLIRAASLAARAAKTAEQAASAVARHAAAPKSRDAEEAAPKPGEEGHSQPQPGIAIGQRQSKVGLALAAVAALAVVALVALFVVPRFLPNHPGEFIEGPPPGRPAQGDQSQDATSSQGGQAQSDAQGSEGQDVPQGLDQQDPSTPAVDFVAYDLPTFDDFSWLTGESAAGYVPEGCYAIGDFALMTDSWKAYTYGDGTDRLCNIVIGGTADGATVTFKWGVVYLAANEESHDDDTPDSTFVGSWDGAALHASGSGDLTIVAAWTDGYRQYATGSLQWPSGEVADVCLARP